MDWTTVLAMLLPLLVLLTGVEAYAGVHYVRIAASDDTLVLNEVQVFPCLSSTNVALNKSSRGSPSTSIKCVNHTLRVPSLVVDGRTSCINDFENTFCSGIFGNYWEVDLGKAYDVCTVVVLQSIGNSAPSANVLELKDGTGMVQYTRSLPLGDSGMQITCTSSTCTVVSATCAACTLSDCGGGAPNAVAASGFFPACTCTCNSTRYVGAYCQHATACTNVLDCNGRATNVSGLYGACACTCRPEWTGYSCSVSNVCTNASDCSSAAATVSGNRPVCACACLPGYAGASCASRECANGVDCNATGTRGVRGAYPHCLCDCKKGYGGPWCARPLTRSASEAYSSSLTASVSTTRGPVTATAGSTSGTLTAVVSASRGTATPSTAGTWSPSPTLTRPRTSVTLSPLALSHSSSWSQGAHTGSASASNAAASHTFHTLSLSRSVSRSGCGEAPPLVVVQANASTAAACAGHNVTDHDHMRNNASSLNATTQCLALQDDATVDGLVVRPARLPLGVSLAHPLRIAVVIAIVPPVSDNVDDASSLLSSWHVASVRNTSTLRDTTVRRFQQDDNGTQQQQATASISGLLVMAPTYGSTTMVEVELSCATERRWAYVLIHWPARRYDAVVDGTTVGALLASASLGGDVSPMASLVMLSLMSCSGTPPPLGMSAYALSPFYDYGRRAIALGNVGLGLAVAMLQVVALKMLSHARRRIAAQGMQSPQKKVFATASDVWFPAVTIRVAEFLLPGTSYGAVLCLWSASSSGVDVAFGVLTVLIVVAALVDSQMLLRRVVLPNTSYVPYPAADPDGSVTAGEARQPPHLGAVTACCGCLRRFHPLEVRWLFPRAQWQPRSMRRACGPLMVAYQRRFVALRVCDALVPLTLSVATGIGVASSGTAHCGAMAIAVGVVHVAFAAVLLVVRPHRYPTDRCFAPIVYALFGAVCLLKQSAEEDGDDAAIVAAMQVGIAATLVTKTICGRWVWFRELQWAMPDDEAAQPRGGTAMLKLRGSDDDGGDGGSSSSSMDLEMMLLPAEAEAKGDAAPLVSLLDTRGVAMLQEEEEVAAAVHEDTDSAQALSFCGNEHYFHIAPAVI